jgi:hypothetical protein
MIVSARRLSYTDVRLPRRIQSGVVSGCYGIVDGGKLSDDELAFFRGCDSLTTDDEGRTILRGLSYSETEEFLQYWRALRSEAAISNSISNLAFSGCTSGTGRHAFNSLEEALTAGKTAAILARESSGQNYEFGVATILGNITPDGTQRYYNSMVATSNISNGITWDMDGVKNLVAVNHSHPDTLGISDYDKTAYARWQKHYPSTFKGVYMFDARGNHMYGPKSPGVFGTSTYDCTSVWVCTPSR